MDARHASEVFTIQSELEDPPSHLGRIFLVAVTKDSGMPAYVSICSSFSTIPGFLTLPRACNTAWLMNATSFPELTTFMCDDSSDPVIHDRATRRCVYSSFQVPQEKPGEPCMRKQCVSDASSEHLSTRLNTPYPCS